jgi:hypothetical protein
MCSITSSSNLPLYISTTLGFRSKHYCKTNLWLVWNEFVEALMEGFDDTITYAAMDKKARNLRYECNSALTYYFHMMELLGTVKITDSEKRLMYLLGGLPRELIKQIHLLNLKEPTDVRDYLVKYEQLDSYLPPLEESAKVTAMAPMQPNRQNQSNQGASGHQ